jgi:hypothetical protein
MTKPMTPKSHFMSVFAQFGDYCGCTVHSAVGWKAHDAVDRLVGYRGRGGPIGAGHRDIDLGPRTRQQDCQNGLGHDG